MAYYQKSHSQLLESMHDLFKVFAEVVVSTQGWIEKISISKFILGTEDHASPKSAR